MKLRQLGAYVEGRAPARLLVGALSAVDWAAAASGFLSGAAGTVAFSVAIRLLRGLRPFIVYLNRHLADFLEPRIEGLGEPVEAGKQRRSIYVHLSQSI